MPRAPNKWPIWHYIQYFLTTIVLAVGFVLVGEVNIAYANPLAEAIAKGIGTGALGIVGAIGSLIAGFAIPVVGFLVRIAAYVFDFGIQATPALVNSDLVNLPWIFLRDMANLVFVFIILVIAISKILGFSKYSDNKIIVNLIIVALLINFSKIIALFLIDISQIISSFLLAQFFQGDISNISGRIAGALNAPGVFSFSKANWDALKGAISGNGSADQIKVVISSLVAIGVMLFLVFYFVKGALQLIKRIFWLVILTAASPLIMLAAILPGQPRNFAKKSWDKFLEALIFLPYFSFVIWFAITAAESVQTGLRLVQSGNTSLASNPATNFLMAKAYSIQTGVVNAQLEPLDVNGIGGDFLGGGGVNFLGSIFLFVILWTGSSYAGILSGATGKLITGQLKKGAKKYSGVDSLTRGYQSYKKERAKAKKQRLKTSLSSRLGSRAGRKANIAGATVRKGVSIRQTKKGSAGKNLRRFKLEDRSFQLGSKESPQLEQAITGFNPQDPTSPASAEAAAAAMTYLQEHVENVDTANPLKGTTAFGKFSGGDIDSSKTARAYLKELITRHEKGIVDETKPTEQDNNTEPKNEQPEVEPKSSKTMTAGMTEKDVFNKIVQRRRRMQNRQQS